MIKTPKPATASTVAPGASPVEAAIGADEDFDAQIKAIQTKMREKAIRDLGGDIEAVKAEIETTFADLEKKSKAIKLTQATGDPKYYAPWEIQAKRIDWPARDFILGHGNKPQTVQQITEGVAVETDADAIQEMLDNDQSNKHPLFAPVGGKWKVVKPPRGWTPPV